MNISSGIDELSSRGLNIFLSIKVSELPSGLINFPMDQRHKTLCLVGAGGPALWGQLPHPLQGAHPIDDFSLRLIRDFAKTYLNDDLEVLFPNDSYLLPLQQLGRLMGFSQPSPMGIDICNDFGLWFSYRAAFLTSKDIEQKSSAYHQAFCNECPRHLCLIDRLHCPIKVDQQYGPAQISYHASQSALFVVN